MKLAKPIRYVPFLIVFLAFILAAGMVEAELYQWVDENGVKHFSDRPTRQTSESEIEESSVAVDTPSQVTPAPHSDPQPNKMDLDTVTNLIEEIAAGQAAMAAEAGPAVELYVTSWCGYCKKAKAFFRSKGIPFAEYDIEKDPAAARRMSSLTSSGGVPFAIINGRPVQGFSEAAYMQALGR